MTSEKNGNETANNMMEVDEYEYPEARKDNAEATVPVHRENKPTLQQTTLETRGGQSTADDQPNIELATLPKIGPLDCGPQKNTLTSENNGNEIANIAPENTGASEVDGEKCVKSSVDKTNRSVENNQSKDDKSNDIVPVHVEQQTPLETRGGQPTADDQLKIDLATLNKVEKNIAKLEDKVLQFHDFVDAHEYKVMKLQIIKTMIKLDNIENEDAEIEKGVIAALNRCQSCLDTLRKNTTNEKPPEDSERQNTKMTDSHANAGINVNSSSTSERPDKS